MTRPRTGQRKLLALGCGAGGDAITSGSPGEASAVSCRGGAAGAGGVSRDRTGAAMLGVVTTAGVTAGVSRGLTLASCMCGCRSPPLPPPGMRTRAPSLAVPEPPLAAIRSSTRTPWTRAMLYIVSPDWTV